MGRLLNSLIIVMILSAQAFPPRSGGIENLMSALARFTVASGETVHVFADGDKAAANFDRETSAPYRVTRFGGLKPLRRRLKGIAVAKAASKDDYIFADSWKSLEHLPNGLSIPVITYAHGNEYPRRAGAAYPKQARIQKALSKASGLIAVSRDTAERAAPFLPEGLTPTLMHPPVAPPSSPSEDDTAFAENLWPTNTIRLLALCRLIDWKGVDQAILALAQLRDKKIDAQLVIAGIGDDRSRLEDLVETQGLKERVVFAGRVEGGRKSALFESADIFVQAGRRIGDQCEGFGITYLEAALHGLPAVSGNAGGAPDASIDGETALIIDASDTKNVTAALEKLIKDKGLRTRMSKAARAHGQAALWPKQIQRILALKDR